MIERLLIALTFVVAGVAAIIAAARDLSDDQVRDQRGRPNYWIAELIFRLPPPLARATLGGCGLAIAALGVWLLTDLDPAS